MNDYESHLIPDKGVFPLSELAQWAADRYGEQPVMRTWNGEGYTEISYGKMRDMVHAIARWLISKGIKKGDRVAVLGENGPKWAASYLGVQTAGAIVVPVDSMMPESGIRHIFADSGARVLFVSGKFINVVSEMEEVKTLEEIVCFECGCEEAGYALDEIIDAGSKRGDTLPKRELSEEAAILYTSGTTGYSKGVILTQNNIMSNVASASRLFPLGEEDTFLSVLPIHHSFECTAGFLLPFYCGCSITYARSLKSAEIMEDIKNTNVTMMVGVPLLFEKMHTGILRGVKKKGKKTQVMFNTLYKSVTAGEKIGLSLGEKLFKSVREKAGFGTVKFFVSGGGPLNPETAYFFNRLGIRLMQGYGLTETSPVTHVNPPWRVQHATVGPPIPLVEHKIINLNENGVGEICIKGPNVFKGYYKNESATEEVLEESGWFHTGDLGIIHKNNYLEIKGRVKNMLVTGGGKNVYPEEIEHHLNNSDYIAESLVLGVKRQSGYGEDVGALIYPDFEQVDLYFENIGKKASPEDVHELIKNEISKHQNNLEEFKKVRRFRIMEAEFQKTSTRKIKRYLYSGDMLNV